MAEAYIVAAVRTAGGRRGGRLSGWHPVELAAQVLDALLERSGIDPAVVEDVIMGCVQQAGEQSNNIGRNAVLASRLPESVPGTTLDRQCGSSQQALHFAAQAVMSGSMDVVIAAGVEAMSRVPMFVPQKLAQENGLGEYMSPEIRRRYPAGDFNQFVGAELIAQRFDLSRRDLERFALASTQRAIEATQAGRFSKEILPVEVRLADGTRLGEMHTVDEGIRFDATLDSIQAVKLLNEGGSISAATASQICDGASGVMVVSERALKILGLTPLARVHHMSVLGGDPWVMLDVPLAATEAALRKAGMKIDDIDLYEVNEAFAPVPLAWLKATGADPERLNVNGGAIALGHPLGASGTKLMTTLINALDQRSKRYGLQTMCEGGGMANVTIIERC
ncbi:acetyl-CoA C-acetyltransferase [Pseudomonas putida]|jgi:acetyl-CoA C-acetyltransferase|uniref:acetyl-CoA C-acetyltransferase n=1 Tax=Pseudomonas putida TaxID=303 RepID=UPI0026601192|nr:acetyl-CoA C-acetyltransferase [Pseudomonas putida]MDO1496570.1 acetyl-CoA C-acetyltransferase [Pseudomonas putida]